MLEKSITDLTEKVLALSLAVDKLRESVVRATAPEVKPVKVAPPPPPAGAPIGATYEQAKIAVLALSKEKGKEVAEEVLKKFGGDRLPKIDPSKFTELLAALNEAMQEEALA